MGLSWFGQPTTPSFAPELTLMYRFSMVTLPNWMLPIVLICRSVPAFAEAVPKVGRSLAKTAALVCARRITPHPGRPTMWSLPGLRSFSAVRSSSPPKPGTPGVPTEHATSQ